LDSCTRPGNDSYDYPVWSTQGLFAEQQCGNSEPTIDAHVVRIDPATAQVAASLAALPPGGAEGLTAAETSDGPRFYFMPQNGSDRTINTLVEALPNGKFRKLNGFSYDQYG
jgi:hypothetical protein